MEENGYLTMSDGLSFGGWTSLMGARFSTTRGELRGEAGSSLDEATRISPSRSIRPDNISKTCDQDSI